MIRVLSKLNDGMFYILIVVVTVLMGIFAINNHEMNKIPPDSVGYYNYGYNIVYRGHYSYKIGADQENFFREPGYPYFVAFTLKIYQLFDTINPITEYDKDKRMVVSRINNELDFIRYFQIVLFIITNLFIYKFLSLFNKRDLSRIVTLLTVFFYPFIVHVNGILRESLLTALFTVMVYFYALFIKEKRTEVLAISSFFLALSILTFQIMVAFIPIYIIVICFVKDNLLRKAKNIIIFLLIIFLTIAPWITKVYRYYPNVKIIKTVGSSLTYESQTWRKAINNAGYQGHNTTTERKKLFSKYLHNMESKEQFDLSFNGWYLEEAKKINSTLNTQGKIVKKIKQVLNYYYYNTFKHNWSPLNAKEIISEKEFYKLIPFAISLILGLMSTISFLYIRWKHLPYLFFHLLYYMGVICGIGDERRRFIPFIPILIYLATVVIIRSITMVKKNHLYLTIRSKEWKNNQL